MNVGYATSMIIAILAYVVGLGIPTSVTLLIASVIMTRTCIYAYFERYLAFRSFNDFKSGRIKHECVACGASCHLKVNLGKDDLERVLQYAKENGITEAIIEHSRNHNWLKRRRDGACVFLKFDGKLPRCSIYEIRPTACRLYPLIPTGTRLRVDPLCPGLSKTKGHTLREHMSTQNVGGYVRKALGKI